MNQELGPRYLDALLRDGGSAYLMLAASDCGNVDAT